jgi:hypothetical protein
MTATSRLVEFLYVIHRLTGFKGGFYKAIQSNPTESFFFLFLVFKSHKQQSKAFQRPLEWQGHICHP